jgi:hypothetical protein
MPMKRERRLSRLRRAMTWSYDRLHTFREKRNEILRQYVGHHYGEHAADHEVPVNLMEMALSIHMRALAARAPRALITAAQPQLKSSALALELATNELIQQIQYTTTLKQTLFDALVGIGIQKVGLSRTGTVEIDGGRIDVGRPFASNVSLTNFVVDMTAHRWKETQFIGDKYRLPFEYIAQSGLYKNVDKLKRNGLYLGASEYPKTEAEPHDLTGDGGGPPDTLRDCCELWDIYDPHDNIVQTIPVHGDDDLVLRTVEYDGPVRGPYHILSFADVPENVMPLAPAMIWMDLHLIQNKLFRRLARQADRQKFIGVVPSGTEKDAQRLVDASDGEYVHCDGADRITEHRMGGIDPSNMQFTIHAKSLATYLWGNLDLLGGLDAHSETATQDAMLNANAGKRIMEMQDRVVDFTRGVLRDLAWYLWTDPFIELPLNKRIPGTNIELPVAFTPETRAGDFFDYSFNVDPYSMQYLSPGQRLQHMMQYMTTVALPMAPLALQQGQMLDMRSITSLFARYTNMDELEEIWTVAPMPPQSMGRDNGQRKPQTSNRNYTHRSIPQRSQRGADVSMAQAMSRTGAAPALSGAGST